MSKFKTALQIPFPVLIKRIWKRILPSEKIDYTDNDIRRPGSNYTINSLITANKINTTINDKLINHYLKHEFSLLGTDWVSGNSNRTLSLNLKHHFFAEKLFKYIKDDYHYINWQLDIKSGLEFDNNKQFDDPTIGGSSKIDIKNCWELGRLQHLPQLAIWAINSEIKEQLILEFKHQSLDFIISNPIGMGVQWTSSKEVGIRVSNLLVAYDIFKQLDKNDTLDDQFTLIFTDSIYRHALFIFSHLEYEEGIAGNNYLFNLVGLLFATTYLSEKPETLKWRDFAEQEIEKEFYRQFFADGGNFEGSTIYHCFAAEAMLYATALMLRNGRSLTQGYIDLLVKSAELINDILKSNGEIPQFGDSDSGRLFKFSAEQALLNYESLLAGFFTIFDVSVDDKFLLEKNIIEQFSKNRKLQPTEVKHKRKRQKRNTKHQIQKPVTTEIKFLSNVNTDEIKRYAYPDFGIYVFKSSHFYLAISAITNKNMHYTREHMHNDKLSFYLQVNGVDLIKENTELYAYQASPEKKNELKNIKKYQGVIVEGVEQNKEVDLFHSNRRIKCEVLEIGHLSITLQANYYGVEHIRKFTILDDQLIITDYCNKPFKVNLKQFDKYASEQSVEEK